MFTINSLVLFNSFFFIVAMYSPLVKCAARKNAKRNTKKKPNVKKDINAALKVVIVQKRNERITPQTEYLVYA